MNTFTRMCTLCFVLASCLYGSGCASVQVKYAPTHSQFLGKKIAVIAADSSQNKGLQWTVLVAGAITVQQSPATASYLETELMDCYRLIDPAQLQEIIKDHQLNLDNVATTMELGRLAGLDGIVTVADEEEALWIFPLLFIWGKSQAKFIDVATGTLVWSATADSNDMTVLPFIPFWKNTAKKAAQEIARKVRVSGSD